MYDVIALGELLIDFTENGATGQGNTLFEANPGGAPCNVLAMLQKLGKSTAFVGKVGEDPFGRFLKGAIERAGIYSGGLLLDGDPAAHTTLAFVQNAPDGDRAFSFYRDPGADELLRAEELPRELLESARVFHFGSLSLTREPARTATRRAVELARRAGAIVSFDPNLRPALWRELDKGREEMLWGCSVCDVLKVAREELEFLTGAGDWEEGAERLRRTCPNIRLLLITDGAGESRALGEKGAAVRPACRRIRAVDTTGAGDVFCGCCLDYLLTHGWKAMEEKALTEMLAFANAAAGLVTTRKGALWSVPEKAEIYALMAEEAL